MIKFLHAADLHLDSPFSGISPERAAQRRKEQRALLTELTELVNAEGCAFFTAVARATERSRSSSYVAASGCQWRCVSCHSIGSFPSSYSATPPKRPRCGKPLTGNGFR